MLERLDASNLDALARGCAVLAAGRGGDADVALTMASRAVQEHGPVPVVRPDRLADDDVVMPCGMVGAPSLAAERVWNGDEGRVLRQAVEELRARRVDALMCFEAAGANGLLPVAWAARLGLPLLDADGMGRAFPDLERQAMHLAGLSASPVVLTDGRGNTLVLHAASDGGTDRLVRDAAASLGGACAAALFCMTAVEARHATIEGSLSRAIELGEATRKAGGGGRPAAAAGALGHVILSEGKVVEVDRDLDPDHVGGAVTVQGAADAAGRQLRLEMQNEYLLVIEDGAVCAAVPDIISVLALDTGEPVATERVRYGERVTIVASPAPSLWGSERGLALAGPRAFGYDVDYEPIAVEHSHARS